MKNTRAAQIIIKPVSPVFIVSSSLIILIWGTRYLILPWGRRYLSPPSPLSKQKRRQTNLFDSFDAFVVIYNSRLQKIMQEVILNCFSQSILLFLRSFLTKSLLSAQFRYTGLFLRRAILRHPCGLHSNISSCCHIRICCNRYPLLTCNCNIPHGWH